MIDKDVDTGLPKKVETTVRNVNCLFPDTKDSHADIKLFLSFRNH